MIRRLELSVVPPLISGEEWRGGGEGAGDGS